MDNIILVYTMFLAFLMFLIIFYNKNNKSFFNKNKTSAKVLFLLLNIIINIIYSIKDK